MKLNDSSYLAGISNSFVRCTNLDMFKCFFSRLILLSIRTAFHSELNLCVVLVLFVAACDCYCNGIAIWHSFHSILRSDHIIFWFGFISVFFLCLISFRFLSFNSFSSSFAYRACTHAHTVYMRLVVIFFFLFNNYNFVSLLLMPAWYVTWIYNCEFV